MTFRSFDADGLLFFASHTDRDFVSIALKDGILEFRFVQQGFNWFCFLTLVYKMQFLTYVYQSA